MRIIAGTARGRRLEAPGGRTTRPISDRAKEGIFNMLVSLGGVDDLRVLDLYAGSGSFGIEALSRGALSATFVEQSAEASAVIGRNLDNVGLADRASILVGPVLALLPTLPEFDLTFADPPYAADPWSELFEQVRTELLVGHAERDIPLPPDWVEVKRRTYGRSHIVIARPGS